MIGTSHPSAAARVRRPRLRPATPPVAAAITLVVVLLSGPSPAAEKRIAVSFDDVPRHPGAFFSPAERTVRLIAALDRSGIEQAGFFVTTGNLAKTEREGGEDRIRAYVAAGHLIANHSASHLWLSRTPLETYLADLDAAAAWLRGRPGYRPWYRFPYLDEGGRDVEKRDAVRAALGERGLANAYVTVDNYDWYLDAIASRARSEGRAMDVDALCDLYTETLVMTADFFDEMAVEAIGRAPAHVILLHETDLAALCLEALAAGLRAGGWGFVSIDEAYRDPIAETEPDTWLLGSGRVAALAHVAGRDPETLDHERTDEQVLDRLFAARVLRPTTSAGAGPGGP